MKNKVQKIENAKKLGFVKPLSAAFENTPVEKEEHKGNTKNYN